MSEVREEGDSVSEVKRGRGRPRKTEQRFIDGRGYVMVRVKDASRREGGYKLEHRIIMEQELGRELYSYERVLHINGDKTDNRLENLMLFPGTHETCPSCHRPIPTRKTL